MTGARFPERQRTYPTRTYSVALVDPFFEIHEIVDVVAESLEDAIDTASGMAMSGGVRWVSVVGPDGSADALEDEPHADRFDARVLIHFVGELVCEEIAVEAMTSTDALLLARLRYPGHEVVAISQGSTTEWLATPATWWKLPPGWKPPTHRRHLRLIRGGLGHVE